MNSVIIISPLSDELKRINDLWRIKKKASKITFIYEDRLTIDFDNNKYVLIDHLVNGKEFYDNSELNEFVLNNFYYYNIIYTDKKTLVDFIFCSSFSENCFLDNNNEEIISLRKLTPELLLRIAE